MKQKVNVAYQDLFTKRPRYIILMGGRGAGRSTVASQFANAKLIGEEYFRCAIMRYILGDIRNSIYREITDRASENGILDSLSINDSTMGLSYGDNSINAVGFKKSSGDQKAKLKSLANYNCVIVEEADEIPEDDFRQLDDSLRTLKGDITIILLLNPPAKSHWIIQRWFDLLPSDVQDFYIPKLKPDITDTIFIHTDYTVNAANMSPQTIKNYENYKFTNPTHYYNMIKGLVPETVKGKIFKNWRKIPSVPFEARLLRRGLDYGYTNDPTTVIDIYYMDGGYILDERLYQRGMSNRKIADLILSLEEPETVVKADSSEPKSNDELIELGVNVIPATKGAGSVNQGIQKLQDAKISYTERSKHLEKEYENYAWFVDKNGVTTNDPIDDWNHCLDGARYGFEDIKPPTSDFQVALLHREREKRREDASRNAGL